MLGLPKNTSTPLATARGLDGDGTPAATGPPVVGPRPRAYIVRGSSRLAGLSLFTKWPSWWNNANWPLVSTRTAGAALETASVWDADGACLAIECTTSG